jgi:hypothetical protein
LKDLSYGITGFLDVLGFADRVRAAKSFKHIDAIVSQIRTIQKEFEFASKDVTVKQVHAGMKKTVLAFSDSVIVNIPMRSTMAKLQGTFDLVMSELAGMALAQGMCATSGLFLRGGVDIGWWYRKSTILASESLVGAYSAEDNAIVPIIRLTDGLHKFVSEHPHRRFYSKEIDPVKTMLRQYSGTGPKGPISFWYLDIRVVAESIDWAPSMQERPAFLATTPEQRVRIRAKGYEKVLREWFRDHARSITRAHVAAQNDRVRKKYLWLAEYHNEIAERFTQAPLAFCKIG